MDSAEIIKSVSAIYERFDIPLNLREHMLRVASVAELICDNWNGAGINKQNIVAAALIHDIGNLAKFDFSKGISVELVKDDPRGVEYWKKAQRELIKKYGTEDANAITLMMAKEIGVGPAVLRLLELDSAPNAQSVADSRDYDAMILLYADQRVGPLGVMSLKERHADMRKRYAGRVYNGVELTEKNLREQEAPALELENMLMRHTKIAPEMINDKAVEPYILKYK